MINRMKSRLEEILDFLGKKIHGSNTQRWSVPEGAQKVIELIEALAQIITVAADKATKKTIDTILLKRQIGTEIW